MKCKKKKKKYIMGQNDKTLFCPGKQTSKQTTNKELKQNSKN